MNQLERSPTYEFCKRDEALEFSNHGVDNNNRARELTSDERAKWMNEGFEEFKRQRREEERLERLERKPELSLEEGFEYLVEIRIAKAIRKDKSSFQLH